MFGRGVGEMNSAKKEMERKKKNQMMLDVICTLVVICIFGYVIAGWASE